MCVYIYNYMYICISPDPFGKNNLPFPRQNIIAYGSSNPNRTQEL